MLVLLVAIAATKELSVKINDTIYMGTEFGNIMTANGIGYDTVTSIQIVSGQFDQTDVDCIKQAPNLKTFIVDDAVEWNVEGTTMLTPPLYTETLTDVKIRSETLTILNTDMFIYCSHVTTFDCPTLETINPDVLKGLGCAVISLPKVTTIGDYAFYGSLLTEFIGDSVTSLGRYSFLECMKLEKISFPKVVEVPESAFQKCVKLSIIDIPNMNSTNGYAFAQCYALETLNHSNMQVVGYNSFAVCISLKAINISAYFIDESGFTGCIRLESITLPNIEWIGRCGFCTCEKLVSIDIQTHVSLGEYVFESAYHLKNVNMPNLVSMVGACFGLGRRLESVNFFSLEELPCDTFSMTTISRINLSSCKRLGFRAFHQATVECELELPNLQDADNAAFEKSSIPSLHAPNWRTSGSDTFTKTAGLDTLILPSLESAGDHFIVECENLSNISLPNLRKIGSFAFYGINIETIELPKLESCGSYVFFGSRVDNPRIDSLTNIGDRAFSGSHVRRVNLESATFVGYYCFESSTELEEVYMKKLKYLSFGTFLNCEKLRNVSLPDAVRVDKYSFRLCTSLEFVNMDKADSIYHSSFQGCCSLESISLPVLRDIVGDGHFENCSRLAFVDIHSVDHVDPEGSQIFRNCVNLERISLPANTPSAFADSVFVNTGRPRLANGALNITICLPYVSAYSNYKAEESSGLWKGLDVSVPGNYDDICEASQDPDGSKPETLNSMMLMIWISVGIFAFAGLLSTAITFIYRNRKKAAKKENDGHDELTLSVVSDFG